MWINQQGQLYEGDCMLGDREATPQEVAAWTAARQKLIIKGQIDQLELDSKIPRVTREFMIDLAEQSALSKGMTLEQLAASNIGYRKLKALDDQIKALRAQL